MMFSFIGQTVVLCCSISGAMCAVPGWPDAVLLQELRKTLKHGTCENMVSEEDKENTFLREFIIGGIV